MKKMIPMILMALPLIAGCVSSNSAEGQQAEAYARCSYTPGPEERAKCMKTELALIQARDRADAEKVQADREAAEQRQSELEASGVPREAAKQVYDPGLHPPQ